MNDTENQSHTHNFDALIGTWKVLNRRKRGDYFSPDQALGEEAEWEEFLGHDRFETQLDGRAVVEHWEATLPSGERALGFSVKAFEPTTHQWVIVWIDNRNPLDFRPLRGTFADGVGTFFQVIETPDGQPLSVRFIWDELTTTTARWQQAFSFDAGTHWDCVCQHPSERDSQFHLCPPSHGWKIALEPAGRRPVLCRTGSE